MQYGEIAVNMVLFYFGERDIQFSRLIFEINLFLSFEVVFQSQTLRMSSFKNIRFYICQYAAVYDRQHAFTELF